MKDIELDFTIGGFKGSKRVWWNGHKLCAFNFEHFYGGKDCPIQSDFVHIISKSIRKLGWTKFWSQMDIIEGRKLVAHSSVFVKFPLLDK